MPRGIQSARDPAGALLLSFYRPHCFAQDGLPTLFHLLLAIRVG